MMIVAVKLLLALLLFGGTLAQKETAALRGGVPPSANNSTSFTFPPGVRRLVFDEERIKVIVLPKDKQKKKKVKRKASKINFESKFTNRVAMEVTRKVYEELVSDPDIQVDFDYELKAILPIEWSDEDEEEEENPDKKKKEKNTGNKKNDRRKLGESDLWGINRVLGTGANRAVPNPAGINQIKVCVVDTGYGLGHPDLPSGTKVAGFNPHPDGTWDVDKYGHGTHCVSA